MSDRRYGIYATALIVLAACPATAAGAETDLGCVQRFRQQHDQRLLLCEQKFEGEHRQLCKAASAQEYDRKVKVCDFRDAPRQ